MDQQQIIANQVDEVLSRYKLSNEQLEYVRDQMMSNLLNGIKGKDSSLKMLPSFVRGIPNGKEHGDFLALDLGGTNFRVLRVKLPGQEEGGRVKVDSQVYIVPNHYMTSTGVELFDHIANCIEDFLTKHNLSDATLPLGFTFSFPCVQKELNDASLLRWTKGFSAAGVIGEDLGGLLCQALDRKKCQSGLTYNINVKAVINDTVGTMMSCAYQDQQCTIGMIVGTGTNACYMENEADMENLDDSSKVSSGLMCINTEWGGFGENGSLDSIRTECDRAVDRESINPGCMIYEKMISGMYMGEVVRYLLLNLVNVGVLFGGKVTPDLATKGRFLSAFVTQIEGDRSTQLKACSQILESLSYPDATLDERLTVRQACTTVSTRAAHLCASGVAALVRRSRDIERKQSDDAERSQRYRITVGVDGTVYKKHPSFRHLLNEKVNELCPDCDVTFRESSDGSGKGAALVTAVACRLSASAERDFSNEEGG